MKVLELFAGIGTQSMALKNIGIEHTSIISEIDKFAIKSYNAIHGETENLGDICGIESLPEVDLLTYSFPCQDISLAGKQAGFSRESGSRSGLLWEVERLLLTAEVKPKYLLVENVKAIVNKKNMPHFKEWCDALSSMGYTNYWKVLNAKDYGIPQNRERCFMVSILGEHDLFMFPHPIPLALRLKDMLEESVDEKYYTDGASRWITTPNGQSCIRKGWASVDGDISQCLTARGVASWNCQYITEPKIENHLAEPEIMIVGNYHKSNHSASRIVDSDGIAPTVMENHGTQTAVVTGYRVRKLTPKECWRLMGIKDSDFAKAELVNSKSQLYKQAGNAIVVNVLEAIFAQLFKGVEND